MEKPDKELSDRDARLQSKAYTVGYTLASLEPEIAKAFAEMDYRHPVIEGIKQGRAQFEVEQKDREIYSEPKWLQNSITKTFNEKSIEPEGRNEPNDKDEPDR